MPLIDPMFLSGGSKFGRGVLEIRQSLPQLVQLFTSRFGRIEEQNAFLADLAPTGLTVA